MNAGGRLVALVVVLAVVLTTVTTLPVLSPLGHVSPVGTASAAPTCGPNELEVEVRLIQGKQNVYQYDLFKSGQRVTDTSTITDISETGELMNREGTLGFDSVNEYDYYTDCFTRGTSHTVEFGIAERNHGIIDVSGVSDDITVVDEEFRTSDSPYPYQVRFRTPLTCSADEEKVRIEFTSSDSDSKGLYTASIDGQAVSVEDNYIDPNKEVDELVRCFEYGDTYTIEMTGDKTDASKIALPASAINVPRYGYDTVRTISHTATARLTITVNRAPTADATNGSDTFSGTTSIVEGVTAVGFNGTDSSDPDGNSLNYTRAFGDGTTARGATASYNYSGAVSTPGGNATFSPDLTVDDGLDWKNTDTDTDFAAITVYNDLDGDGLADDDDAPGAVDPDDDGDGITDSIESVSTSTVDLPAEATTVTVGGSTYPDSDGDALVDLWDTDSDSDGIADSIENTTDSDGDGTADYRDVDSDNDGVLDSAEGATDTDGDGIPNYLDDDSDGDGIPDRIEGTGSAVDSINVTLTDSSLRTGRSTTLTAVATFANANEFDVTTFATLGSNDTAVVTVDANGTVSAVGAGVARLNATLESVTGTANITVSNPLRRSRGGGGGGSNSAATEPQLTTTATETETGTETEVTVQDAAAGEPVTVQREDGEPLAQSESTSVDSLTITSETARAFSARVSTSETLDENNPDGAVDLSPDRDGSVPVGYLTIDHDLDDEVTEATIGFSVRSERVGDDEVRLYRNTEGSWNPLETRFVSEADGVAQYEAITPGFSTFAIGLSETTEAGSETPDTAPTTNPTAPQPTENETPGFGFVVGLAALLGMTLLIARRGSSPTDD